MPGRMLVGVPVVMMVRVRFIRFSREAMNSWADRRRLALIAPPEYNGIFNSTPQYWESVSRSGEVSKTVSGSRVRSPSMRESV